MVYSRSKLPGSPCQTKTQQIWLYKLSNKIHKHLHFFVVLPILLQFYILTMLWGVCHRTLVGPGAHTILQTLPRLSAFCGCDAGCGTWVMQMGMVFASVKQFRCTPYRFTKPRLQRKDRLGDGVTSSGPAWVHSLSAILQHASSGWRLGYFPFYWTFKVLVTLTKVFPADSWRRNLSVWWTWPHPGRGRGGESLQSGPWFGVCHFQWKSFHQLFGLTDCSFSREYMFRSKLG